MKKTKVKQPKVKAEDKSGKTNFTRGSITSSLGLAKKINAWFPVSMLEDFDALAKEYSEKANVRLTFSDTLRVGFEQQIAKLKAELNQAKRGKFHAKTRKQKP